MGGGGRFQTRQGPVGLSEKFHFSSKAVENHAFEWERDTVAWMTWEAE